MNATITTANDPDPRFETLAEVFADDYDTFTYEDGTYRCLHSRTGNKITGATYDEFSDALHAYDEDFYGPKLNQRGASS